MKTCSTCLHVLADHTPCDSCLDPPNTNGSFPYNNYVEATREKIYAERHRQELAGRNIVLGREGEHEINANWTLERTRKELSQRCEDVGGVSWRKGDSIIVDKQFDAAYTIVFKEDKLTEIYRENPNRGVPKHLWWHREGPL